MMFVLKELAPVSFDRAMLQYSIILLLVKRTGTRNMTGHRSVKRIKAMAFDFRHDEEEADTQSTSSGGP
jgi:hypothetical protein